MAGVMEKKRRAEVRGILEQMRESGMPASPFPGSDEGVTPEEAASLEFEEMKGAPARRKKKKQEREESAAEFVQAQESIPILGPN